MYKNRPWARRAHMRSMYIMSASDYNCCHDLESRQTYSLMGIDLFLGILWYFRSIMVAPLLPLMCSFASLMNASRSRYFRSIMVTPLLPYVHDSYLVFHWTKT